MTASNRYFGRKKSFLFTNRLDKNTFTPFDSVTPAVMQKRMADCHHLNSLCFLMQMPEI